jgi:hypothetical protein
MQIFDSEEPVTISVWERIVRLSENAVLLMVAGVIGALVGTFLDGRFFMLFAPAVWLALHRSNAFEGIERPMLTIVWLLFGVGVPVGLFAFGVYINKERPGVFTPKDYADAVKGVLPAAPSAKKGSNPLPVPPAPARKPIPAACIEDQNYPYKCKSDKELVGLLTGEQEKLLSLAADGADSIRALPAPAPFVRPPGEEIAMRKDVHRYIADQIRKCCIRDLTDLRAEAIKRIGSPRMDLKEDEAWEHFLFSLQDNRYSLGLWPETVEGYSEYITKMEQLLHPK